MKTKRILLGLALALPATAALGQGPARGPGPGRPPGQAPMDEHQPPRPGHPPGPGHHPPGPPPLLFALDTDRDGIISAAEIAASATSLLTLDKNGDGQLTPEDLRPPKKDGLDEKAGKPPGDRPEHPRPPRDKDDGDKPPVPPLIGALDPDGDHVISATEIANAPASLLKLDKNGDGQLGPSEYGMRPPGPGEKPPGEPPAPEQ